MLTYPDIDPVLFRLGPLELHWYGLAYVVALLSGWFFLRWRYQKRLRWPAALWSDLLFYSTLGVLLGGRLGSMLFYQGSYLLQDPLALLRVWEGGMSLHGGVVGVVVALWLLARRHNLSLLRLGDMVVLVVPFGLFLGRLGNFVNGELWGRPTTLPWGMVFPHVDDLPRHPSQLYQALLEGAFLFVALNFYARRPRPAGAVAGYFLVGYAALRILAEQWREPDAHIGFVVGSWTLGQLLSLPMAGLGLFLIYWSRRHAADSEKPSAGGG